jgi:hypothetical protein
MTDGPIAAGQGLEACQRRMQSKPSYRLKIGFIRADL